MPIWHSSYDRRTSEEELKARIDIVDIISNI